MNVMANSGFFHDRDLQSIGENKGNNQGIIQKKGAKNDRNNFEISALLSCERGNPEQEKFKIKYRIVAFTTPAF